MSDLSPFAQSYLEAWTTPDASTRREIVDRLWAPQGRLSVSSLGRTLTGKADITAHLQAVHDDLIATKGMIFRYDQELTSGDARLLRWSMTTPAGDVVGRGVDTIVFSEDARAQDVYMFMGVS